MEQIRKSTAASCTCSNLQQSSYITILIILSLYIITIYSKEMQSGLQNRSKCVLYVLNPCWNQL